MSHMNICNKRF